MGFKLEKVSEFRYNDDTIIEGTRVIFKNALFAYLVCWNI
jgi:hypothetical protein